VSSTTAELILDRSLGELVSHSNVDLAGLDAPQRVARAAVHDALEGDADDAWLHDLDIVASEVVTNALKHTPGAVRMRLEIYERGVAMGVIDRGDDFDALIVVPADADPGEIIEATSGRGLLIVSCLAQCLKVGPAADGKIVTAVLERPAGAR
jgi:anti-sigma regulatory factor (Ser/Thr protein kinase)